jgi:hypothetical protein
MLGVVAGTKSWYVRDPAQPLPGWLDETLKGTNPGQSTREWLESVATAEEIESALEGAVEKKSDWREHIWHCSQGAGEVMFIPAGMRHAIHNEEETFAWSVQVDMQMNGGQLLHATSFHGHEEATALLLQAGAEVDAQAGNGETTLHCPLYYTVLLYYSMGNSKTQKVYYILYTHTTIRIHTILTHYTHTLHSHYTHALYASHHIRITLH